MSWLVRPDKISWRVLCRARPETILNSQETSPKGDSAVALIWWSPVVLPIAISISAVPPASEVAVGPLGKVISGSFSRWLKVISAPFTGSRWPLPPRSPGIIGPSTFTLSVMLVLGGTQTTASETGDSNSGMTSWAFEQPKMRKVSVARSK